MLPEMSPRMFGRPAWSYLWFLSLIAHRARAVPTNSEYCHGYNRSRTHIRIRVVVPSAASFYVSRLPDLHQDPTHPLHIYAGHIISDPDASSASDLDVLAHLFFVMVKARRAADKERLMFWFNVSLYNVEGSPPT